MTEPTIDRIPVSYVQKSREYYLARGYTRPYVWAQHDGAPFTEPSKPLSESRVGIVTTTVPFQEQGASQEQGEVPPDAAPPTVTYAHECEPRPTRMFTNHLSWHKEATNTDDVETFLPLQRLNEFVESGRIGSLSPRFYGVPTSYSQRESRQDAATIAQWCLEDEVDLVLLVPL